MLTCILPPPISPQWTSQAYCLLLVSTRQSLLPSGPGLSQFYLLMYFHVSQCGTTSRNSLWGLHLSPIYHSVLANIMISTKQSSLILQMCPNRFSFHSITIRTRLLFAQTWFLMTVFFSATPCIKC